MIYSLRTTLFKTEMIFDRIYMSYLERFLGDDEEFVKSVFPYKSGEAIIWFTNKKMIFTSAPNEFCVLGKVTEVEFLPYKNIKRYTLLDANSGSDFTINLFLGEDVNISLFVPSMNEVIEILKLVGNNI